QGLQKTYGSQYNVEINSKPPLAKASGGFAFELMQSKKQPAGGGRI
ncbi:hypothetical protein ABIE28_004273, partial [Devosia sp. 2618]